MNKTMERILALLLAMLMVLSLAACGESDEGGSGGKGSDKSDDRITPVVKDPSKDAAGYLAMALENTMNDLADRYADDPFVAIGSLIDTKGTVTVSGEIDAGYYYGTIDLKEISLSYDLDKAAFLLAADVAAQGLEVEGGVFFSEDFIGVSVPMLFGDSSYYGFEPKNIRKQLEKSPLYEAMGGSLSRSDWEEIDLLDDMLDLLWDSEYIDIDKLITEMETLSMDYIKELDVDYEEDTFRVDGEKVDGYVFTATVTSDDMADLMEKLFDIMLDMPMWDTLQKIAALGGEELDMDDLQDQVDEAVREIRREKFEMEVTYYVADEKVVKMETFYEEYDMSIAVDYYSDDSITVDFDYDGTRGTVISAVESTKKGYNHTVTVIGEDSGNTAVITVEWDGDELTMAMTSETDFDSYKNTNSMSLSCGLSTTKKGFVIEDLTVASDYYYGYWEESYHDEVSVPLTIEYTSGGSVSTPKKTRNVFEMTEDELMELVGNFQGMM